MSLAEALHRAGVTRLLLREPHLEERALVALIRALAPRLHLTLSARCAQAEALARGGGWGLHLTGGSDVGAVRARFHGLLGYSAHSLEDAVYAWRAGADYLLLSPIWRPGSKPKDERPPLGLREAARVQQAVSIPIFALGGLTPDRAARCREAGIYGAAAIGAVFGSGTPEGVEEDARRMLAACAGPRQMALGLTPPR